ncbi:AsnC family transcriptional regulator [Actibacterium mucosum KCTC 23349]|uniref:AsnC family transcriptional regulator n=1 Tax=Actibacterium mucosum KCTC 23349 TaxID=1454373 RepID=A0A037ZKH7_9RHOB|nr:Lrp/AsnC family transcriptional regulator [Actibacterium mucosum]KAJ56149.1 AsnC family transcriptional regulator [Actibacterium mucosum KCTC 23349]
MDALDQKILTTLQADGRIAITDLADRVGLSPTPCARRVARLEAEGIITGYTARVDAARLGLPLTAFVFVELDRTAADTLAAFEAAVARFDAVMECHLMTGTRDILLRVTAADLADFDRFIETQLMRTPGIRAMRSSFTLRTMVQRDTLPVG